MTLYRKILSLILLVFLLLLGMVFTLQFIHTRDYLAQQLESDVQNTATTLGLALEPHLKNRDPVAVEALVNVVFDGGFYREVSVEIGPIDTRVQRVMDARVRGVPEWFIGLALFEPVEVRQVLTSGWLQLGTLTIKGHPGYAYQQLWRLMSQQLFWFSVALLACILIVVYGLRLLIRPLHMLEQRALDIAHQHFGKPLPEPQLPELTGVVQAFNSMSLRLQRSFEGLAEEAEELRREAFQDRVTGFGNRSFFNGQLQAWLSEPGGGALIIIEVHGLHQVYSERGFQGRDRYLQSLAELLRNQVRDLKGAALARLSVAEFAALLPGLDEEQLDELLQRLHQLSTEVVVNPFELASSPCSIGAALRYDGVTAAELMSQADLALQQAKEDGPGGTRRYHCDREVPVLGREGWRQLVRQALEHGWLFFQLQPVTRIQDSAVLHQELFSTIHKGDEHYLASQFMPFVDHNGLGARFDRAIIEALDGPSLDLKVPVAVNLSASTLGDAGFMEWLFQWLEARKTLRDKLIFELHAGAVNGFYPQMEMLCHQLHRLGVRYGIDRFGHSFEGLGLLAALRPAYLKVDIAYLLDEQGHENPAFITALSKLARIQETDVIVTRVESAAQLKHLENLPVDAYQGFIKPPQAWRQA